ncbi:hypothetical protein PPACK8108_LOCUS10777 [Phakopsora pachyrhizi]|uniref:Uncharacterized protein n=1 Tax=Phakopsora pachyrhizi TaxID=170000 RepID=A0AAV0AZG5_PHAPC|nr:hypothetical protein PPACK8108_LOCUS10777 [Phakopsora pachyrhizi]
MIRRRGLPANFPKTLPNSRYLFESRQHPSPKVVHPFQLTKNEQESVNRSSTEVIVIVLGVFLICILVISLCCHYYLLKKKRKLSPISRRALTNSRRNPYYSPGNPHLFEHHTNSRIEMQNFNLKNNFTGISENTWESVGRKWTCKPFSLPTSLSKHSPYSPTYSKHTIPLDFDTRGNRLPTVETLSFRQKNDGDTKSREGSKYSLEKTMESKLSAQSCSESIWTEYKNLGLSSVIPPIPPTASLSLLNMDSFLTCHPARYQRQAGHDGIMTQSCHVIHLPSAKKQLSSQFESKYKLDQNFGSKISRADNLSSLSLGSPTYPKAERVNSQILSDPKYTNLDHYTSLRSQTSALAKEAAKTTTTSSSITPLKKLPSILKPSNSKSFFQASPSLRMDLNCTDIKL